MAFRFGPAGRPTTYKGSTVDVPSFLRKIGLNAFEYQAVRGVKIRDEDAVRLGENAIANDVLLSLHAPYFINFSSDKSSVVEKSIERLTKSLKAAYAMEAYVVVFHPGYYGNLSPVEAAKKVIANLNKVVDVVDRNILKRVFIGPETTGRKKQVGSLEEIIMICRGVDHSRPVVDWAHLYARSEGTFIVSESDVIDVIEKIERELGKDPLKPLHCHYSKIAYGKGGEREHKTLDASGYGPDFTMICRTLLNIGVEAVFISESPILEKDALKMKKIYEEEVSRIAEQVERKGKALD